MQQTKYPFSVLCKYQKTFFSVFCRRKRFFGICKERKKGTLFVALARTHFPFFNLRKFFTVYTTKLFECNRDMIALFITTDIAKRRSINRTFAWNERILRGIFLFHGNSQLLSPAHRGFLIKIS